MRVFFIDEAPPTEAGRAEVRAALETLRCLRGVRAELLPLGALRRIEAGTGDVFWWHRPAAELPAAAVSETTARALARLADRGAGFLLTLGAASLPAALGLGGEIPEGLEATWEEGTGDFVQRGFLAFDRHPILNRPNRLGNVVLTWTPAAGEPFWRAFYGGRRPERAIALGCRYISRLDGSADVWEYRIGRGAILCVGSFLYFNARCNRKADYLAPLLENFLAYLSDPATRTAEGPYWPRDEVGCREAGAEISAALPRLSFHFSTPDLGSDGLPAIAATGGHNYFSCAGRRALLSGFEGSEVREVWSYPTRIIKNLRWAVRTGDGELVPQSELFDGATVTPDSVIQRYSGRGLRAGERIFASIDKPAASLQLRFSSEREFQLEFSFAVDLMLMWPMPIGSVGALLYRYDPASRTIRVASRNKGCWLALGLSEAPDEVTFADESPQEVRLSETERYRHSQLGCRLRLPRRAAGEHTLELIVAGGRLAEGFEREIEFDSAREAERSAAHYLNLEGRKLRLSTPDADLDEGAAWGQRKIDSFLVETPTLGRSLVAGFAASGDGWLANRPGYGWYFGRDSLWTSLALLTLGRREAVADTLRFLARHQAPDGKILHELSPSGYCHHDSADANPLFLIVAERYLAWTGDRALIGELAPALRRALEFCFRWDRDGDGLTENTGVGHGWIESGALFGAHVTFYLAGLWLRALESAKILLADEDDQLLERTNETASAVREALLTRFWDPARRTYCYGLLPDGSMSRSESIMPAAVTLFGDTDPERDRAFLRRVSGPDVVADWGARMISELDERYNPVGYHYGSVWPLYTGWLGLAQYAAGRPLQGFELLLAGAANHKHFSAGCFNEVLRGDRYDQAGVCPQQAWSAALILMLLTGGLLGLRPEPDGRLRFAPAMPPHWHRAEVGNIRWADGSVSLAYRRSGGEATFTVSGLESGARLTLAPIFPQGSRISAARLNGAAISPEVIDSLGQPQLVLPLDGLEGEAELRLELEGYLSPLPALVPPRPGEVSVGFRIIDWSQSEKLLEVELAGRAGSEATLTVVDPGDVLDDESISDSDGERKFVPVRFPDGPQRYSALALRLRKRRGG